MPKRDVYCYSHNEYKIKNANGSFVCVLCLQENN